MDYPMHDRCALDHEMSTTNRGSINPAERGNMIFPVEVEHQPVNSFGFDDDCDGMAGTDTDNRTGA
jgi:hypothetical protein